MNTEGKTSSLSKTLPRPVLPFLLSGAEKGLARLPAKQQQNTPAANAAVPGATGTAGSEPSLALPPRRHLRAAGRALNRRKVFHAARCNSPAIKSLFCKANKSEQLEGLLKRAGVKPCSEGHVRSLLGCPPPHHSLGTRCISTAMAFPARTPSLPGTGGPSRPTKATGNRPPVGVQQGARGGLCRAGAKTLLCGTRDPFPPVRPSSACHIHVLSSPYPSSRAGDVTDI